MSRMLISTSTAALLALSGAALAQTSKGEPRAPQQAPASREAPAVGGAAADQAPAPDNQSQGKDGQQKSTKDGKKAQGSDKAPDTKGKNAQEKASPDSKKARSSEKQDSAVGKEGKAVASEKAPASEKARPAKETSTEPEKSQSDMQKSTPTIAGGSTSAQGAAQLQPEQRTRVQTAFSKHKSGALNTVNFKVNVGVAVPRSVQLVTVPDDILVVVPQYRRYRYFIVDNRVCIIDPETYLIVEIITLI